MVVPTPFYINRLIALMVTLVTLFAFPAYASPITPGITLSTDSQSVYLGDTVVIEMQSVELTETADISPLFQNADLIRETTGTRIAVVNGRVVEIKVRRMDFQPRREGKIRFGPLQGDTLSGSVSSNVLTVEVLPAIQEQWLPDDNDLQISIQLQSDGQPTASNTKKVGFSPYVGQQIILDITLKHRYAIANEKVVLPSFNGFDVYEVFSQRRTTQAAESDTPDNNKPDWRIIQWRYHLFAQRSGAIEIEPVSWTGTLIRTQTQRAQFNQTQPALQFDIKAATQTHSWWLPASTVSLSEHWSKDPRELTAGDELYRTITLTANNVLANHLPQIQPLESRAISSTLIGQTRQQKLIGNQIEAIATFRYRLVAQSPIPVFLDTVRVAWFDTKSSQARETIIPARRINVGLPERADLLAELALQDSWWDKSSLQLRTLSASFAYWHVSLVLLGLIAAWMLFFYVKLQIRSGRPAPSGRGSAALPEL